MSEEKPGANVDVAVIKVMTCVGIKVIRANGAVEDVKEFETWRSPTLPQAKD